MDKAISELQSTIESAIFEYERKTGDFIYALEIRRKSELDFSFSIKSDSNKESGYILAGDAA